MSAGRAEILFSRGFRPFFLLAGAQAGVALGLWLGMLRGWVPVPAWSTPFQWHAHEMLFGFAAAAIAGFLLTSVPVWTARPALAPYGLAGLAGLWLAGRLAVFFAAALPSPWIAASVDVAFLVGLNVAISPSIFAIGRRHNYVFPVLLGVLAIANVLTHLGGTARWPNAGATGMRLGIGVVVLMIVILGGRLVSLFTRAALRRTGIEPEATQRAWANAAAAPALAAFVVLDTLWPGTPLAAVFAFLAAAIIVLRTKGWGLRAAFADPLLWSMHVAYLWIPVGLAALGLSVFSPHVTRNLALHALTVGAIGGMILAIMTRVALGHTGRPFRAPPGIAVAYALVSLAALTRTLLPALFPLWLGALLLASGLLWIAAFATFLVIYTPYLLGARVDRKPG